MEFLVEITVELPPGMERPRRAEIMAAERAYGMELRRRGVIERIWRVPGGLRNVGVWVAADATELHDLLSGLPLYPWTRITVTALARHPLEEEPH